MQVLRNKYIQSCGYGYDIPAIAMQFAIGITLVINDARPAFLDRSNVQIDENDIPLIKTVIDGWAFYTKHNIDNPPKSKNDSQRIGEILGYYSPWPNNIDNKEISEMQYLRYILTVKEYGQHNKNCTTTKSYLIVGERVNIKDLNIQELWRKSKMYTEALSDSLFKKVSVEFSISSEVM